MDYYRYVDDILIIYRDQKTNIMRIDEFSAIQPKLKFSMEQQTLNGINYLDLAITKNRKELRLGIYRKPNTTDLILRNTSHHPYEHKKSAINYLFNRMNTHGLTKENKNKEEKIMAEILKNEYPHRLKDKNHPRIIHI
jgi:hypothetical protein